MGTSGLICDVFANTLVMYYAAVIIRSARDRIDIAKLEGSQAMILAILSALVALIRTL